MAKYYAQKVSKRAGNALSEALKARMKGRTKKGKEIKAVNA